MVNKGTFSPVVKALEAQLRLEIWDQATELAVDRGGLVYSRDFCSIMISTCECERSSRVKEFDWPRRGPRTFLVKR